MSGDTVTVEAPARLHFGLLDLRGALGRRFGGIGAPAPEVSARVSVSLADDVEAELARLQVIVDKTAGPAEHEAMALLTEYVRSAPGMRPLANR